MTDQHDQLDALATIRRQIGHDDITSDDIALRMILQARDRRRQEHLRYVGKYDPIVRRDALDRRLPRLLWRAVGLLAVMAAVYALIVLSGVARGLELPSVLQWMRGR